MHILLETERLRLRRFTYVLLGNVASRRVMQKCGLREAGRFVYAEDVLAGRDAAERAAVKYTITRTEWLQQRG